MASMAERHEPGEMAMLSLSLSFYYYRIETIYGSGSGFAGCCFLFHWFCFTRIISISTVFCSIALLVLQ